MKVASEEDAPARRFATRTEAQEAADRITNAPRKGKAWVQFVGAWNCWTVNVNLRANPYGNPGVLRTDGTVAKYH